MVKTFKMKKIDRLLNKFIPGGAQTYSRGFDQFPDNAPQILSRGNAQYIYDDKNRKFLDYGMGLRSIILGYNNKDVNQAAIKKIKNGNNLPRPSEIELQFAKNLINTIPHIDMVKFAKNSSNAVTAAIKLSRSYNGKKIILRCKDHPFFSFDDWFIGNTDINRGIPNDISKLTKNFRYGDLENIKKLIKKYKNQISCLVMEAATTSCPKFNLSEECCGKYNCIKDYKKNHYLKEVQLLCKQNKIVFIIDETITGFRWHLKGASYKYDLNPDLVIYGKAIANGFSMAVLAGKREIMNCANILKKKHERTFLLSSTHGGEMCSLGAANETLNILKKNKVIPSIWQHGNSLINKINNVSRSLDMSQNIHLFGVPCSPYFATNINGKADLKLRTILLKELIKEKIFMPCISICALHNDKDALFMEKKFKKILQKIKKIIGKKIKTYSVGRIVKPVFRKFN